MNEAKRNECPLSRLVSRRDTLIRELWLVFRNMSDIVGVADFEDDDLGIWSAVTKHNAIQNRLDKSGG